MLAGPALAAKVDEAADAGARYVVEHFGGEITELVSGTTARWDGEETRRRLALLLGPDLQYIRINGPAAGGLAGPAFHRHAQLPGYGPYPRSRAWRRPDPQRSRPATRQN